MLGPEEIARETSNEAPPPTRFFMDDPDIEWEYGPPDFTTDNKKYMAERKMRHPEGSLAKIVENLVKTWEMESTHKTNIKVDKVNNSQNVS